MAAPAASDPSSASPGLAVLDEEDRNRRRAEWRTIAGIVTVVAIASFAFGWTGADDNDAGGHWLSGLQGIVNSLMASVPVIWLELAGARSRLVQRMRQWPFWAFFLAKLAAYVAFFVATIQLTRLLFHPINPQSFGFDARFFEILLFAGAMSLIANVAIEIGRLVGFRELRRLLTGRYARPRQERRVFLMVDMKASTAAAERLGDLQFHQILNMFFNDIAGAAYDHGAEIHKYIGDEVILTWIEAEALRGARCALCPFGIARRIERHADAYRARFGFVPSFRAALHAGDIVSGEMGTMKREIAFIGDTLNTTARLVDVARDCGHDIVVSGDLAGHLRLPPGLRAVPLQAAQLRGKQRPLPLAALELA
ncbi:adenylate/guanylate cyclase domain-containing protein [Vineibacter terrae]|uniref:adenylate/guanylate cyclase domain-containing protein n=1 Tax=Vineibacter terrae TaxID=2586908 RepID=UPI002E381CDC|nr:adenylate/guanylate cyclase domain-containing protein [Vineibacter terrae]HEX2888588.1 adenylate/guanylate cyclase domain-containing protein [Vineibacter terrae]